MSLWPSAEDDAPPISSILDLAKKPAGVCLASKRSSKRYSEHA